MTIDEDFLSMLSKEIEQGFRDQLLMTAPSAATTEQNGSSGDSTQNPIKEVYRTGRSQNIVAHPSLHKIRGRFVGGLHTQNYTNTWYG
jgi:hypothetical protein